MSGSGDSKDQFDIGIFLGGIRPNLWKGLYDSLKESCNRHTFQLVIAGPHSPPQEMLALSNFKFIKDWGGPARGAQLAVNFVESPLASLGADDGLYRPKVLSDAIDRYRALALEKKETEIILGIKYGEGGNLMADAYWKAWSHPPLQLAGIPQSAPMVLNSVARTSKYMLEGYDLINFSTCNWGGHDMYHRWIYGACPNIFKEVFFEFYPVHALECTWMLDGAGIHNDHQPVAEADDYRIPTSDYKLFSKIYSETFNKNNPRRLEDSDWRKGEKIWGKRFKLANT